LKLLLSRCYQIVLNIIKTLFFTKLYKLQNLVNFFALRLHIMYTACFFCKNRLFLSKMCQKWPADVSVIFLLCLVYALYIAYVSKFFFIAFTLKSMYRIFNFSSFHYETFIRWTTFLDQVSCVFKVSGLFSAFYIQ